jgi:hypothetical protein
VFTRRGFLFSLIAGSLPGCGSDSDPTDWVSLDRTLNGPETLSIPFVSKYPGNHQVVFEFAWPIPDARVESLVTSAAATTGSPEAPTFDFSWRLQKEGQIVARREAPQRSTGVRETRTSGLGEGSLTSMGLVFGEFNLEPGNQYTFLVLPGSELSAVIRVSPRVVVVHQPYRVTITP